jgi:hypothetical protein
MSLLRAAIVLILAGGATSALADQITCESRSSGTEACGTVQAGSSVRLARQLSGTPCIEGRNWGTGPDRDSIWVSGGCRAVFDVQPPYDSTASQYRNSAPQFDSSAAPERNTPQGSPQWQRGFEDGQRGNFDQSARSNDYRLGYEAGRDAQEDGRYGDAPADSGALHADEPRNVAPSPAENYRDDAQEPAENYREDQPRDAPPPPAGYVGGATRSDDRHDGTRYASVDSLRAGAGRACVDQATSGQSFGPDRVAVDDVRWVGHGMFEVSLETPAGPLTCAVDRNGNVRSIDER